MALKYRLDQMLTKEGTLFVLSTKATCYEAYDGWYQVVVSHPGLITDPSVQWVGNTSATVIFGCYKRCPVMVGGQRIPVVELGDDETEVFIDVVLNMAGKVNFELITVSTIFLEKKYL